jgi:hypothetical protein
MQAQGPFVVLEVYEQASKFGGDVTVVVMASPTPELVHTYLDTSNKNYAFWQDIVTLKNSNYGVVIDDLKYKVKNKEIQRRYIKGWNKNEPLINADSKPKILHTSKDPQDFLDMLVEILESQS